MNFFLNKIFLLPVAAVILILLAYFVIQGKSSPVTVSLPFTETTPIPTHILIEPSPTVAPDILNLENNLNNIENDFNNAKTEDKRFIPPSFILDLGI